MRIASLTRALSTWDQTRRLTPDELAMWTNFCTQPPYLDYLQQYETNSHLWVPLMSDNPIPVIGIARDVHRAGYQERYFPNPELLPLDAAGRRILGVDTDATQLPGTIGIAWMCCDKKHITRENDVYGLMYELLPREPFDPTDHSGKATGWRTLPVAKLFVPLDRPSPLSAEGIQLLDDLERSGAQIVESSGLSVRPSVAARGGLIFHEILRRMVHQAIIVKSHGGPAKVLAFAIVEETRNSIQIRMGEDNFVPLGKSFVPPGAHVDQETRLAPSIVELNKFFDRMVTSYRKALETNPHPKALVKSIRDYTRGLPWQYIRQYPAMIALLAELDESFPTKSPRDMHHGWHDQCEHNKACHVCHPAVSIFDHIQRPHYGKYLIA